MATSSMLCTLPCTEGDCASVSASPCAWLTSMQSVGACRFEIPRVTATALCPCLRQAWMRRTDGQVTFRYRDSTRGKKLLRIVSGAHFLWLVLHTSCPRDCDDPATLACSIPTASTANAWRCYAGDTGPMRPCAARRARHRPPRHRTVARQSRPVLCARDIPTKRTDNPHTSPATDMPTGVVAAMFPVSATGSAIRARPTAGSDLGYARYIPFRLGLNATIRMLP